MQGVGDDSRHLADLSFQREYDDSISVTKRENHNS